MRLRRLAQRCRSRKGQTLVESALSIAIVLVVLMGVLEVTIAMYDFNYVAYAARQGTRWAMVRGSKCTLLTECNATAAQIQSYVRGLNYPMIQPSSLIVSTVWMSKSSTAPTAWTPCTTAPCNLPGNQVQLEVGYPFTMNLPLVGPVQLNLRSTSSMVISR